MTYSLTISTSTPEELSAILAKLHTTEVQAPAIQSQPSYQQQAIAPTVSPQAMQPGFTPDPSALYYQTQTPVQQGYGQPQNGYSPEQSAVPVYNPQATQQFQQQQGQVPIASAPAYTMEQLGVAAGPFVDAGRGPELVSWLNQRGASALSQLDKTHYGDFATYLRSLGAKI